MGIGNTTSAATIYAAFSYLAGKLLSGLAEEQGVDEAGFEPKIMPDYGSRPAIA